jgi:hypothetical protein
MPGNLKIASLLQHHFTTGKDFRHAKVPELKFGHR